MIIEVNLFLSVVLLEICIWVFLGGLEIMFTLTDFFFFASPR